MVWIRLARIGCRNQPLYRVIAADSHSQLDVKHLEVLGFYNPFTGEDGASKLVLNLERLKYWMSIGARPSDPLHGVLIREGFLDSSSMLCSTSNEGPSDVFSAFSGSSRLGSFSHKQPGVYNIISRKLSNVPQESTGELFGPEPEKPIVLPGDNQLLLKNIKEALSENNKKLARPFLEHKYNKEFRHHLASNCLLLPNGLQSESTQFIHTQHHLVHRRPPQYLSSYELMLQRERIGNDEEWDHFWNQIVSSRVFIVDEWCSNIANVETLHYDYGITGFCKGEVDASFHDGKGGMLGKATISMIIWKDDKIVCAEVYRDVDCSSIHVAEAYAVLALFFKCIEIGIEHLVLWTDNSDIQGSITGSYTISQDRDKDKRDILLLLGCMKKKFTRLIALRKPRELMFLADYLTKELIRAPESMDLEDALKKFDYQLRQKALFRLSKAGTTNTILKKFAPKKCNRKEQTKCFLIVDNLDKIDAIVQLKETLHPSELFIAFQNLDEKPEDFQSQVEEMLGTSLSKGKVKNDCTILHHTTKYDGCKRLLVVADGTLPEDRYNFLDCFTVIFVSSMEQKELDPAIEEISALSYCYFIGIRKGPSTR